METPDFLYVVFLFFFLAIGAIVFVAWLAQVRSAKARAKAARARKAARRAAAPRPPQIETAEPVQIDDSAPRPDPDVVARPSTLDEPATTGTGGNPPTGRPKLYWDFWAQFLDRLGTEHPGWTRKTTPSRASRYNLPTGTSGVAYATAFTQRGLGVQLYFSSPDASLNLSRFEALRAQKDEFERALGHAAEWDDKPGKKAATVGVTSHFDNVADVELWPAMLDWVLSQQVRFRQAVEAIGGADSLKETMPRTLKEAI